MEQHGFCYWFTEWFVIFLADIAAVVLGYFLIERRLKQHSAIQKEKLVRNRLKAITGGVRSWVGDQNFRNGQRKQEHPGSMYGLDLLLNESSVWEFEDKNSLQEQANNLSIAIEKWNQFVAAKIWNANTCDARINEISDRADELWNLVG